MYSILIRTLMIRRLSTKLKRFTSSVHLTTSNNINKQPIKSIQGSQTLPIIQTGLITSASSWGVVHYVEFLLQGIHQYSSLPWWVVIMGTTVVLRTFITVPLAVHQNKILAKIELLKPTIIEYSEAIKHNIVTKCRRENLPSHVASMRYKKEVRKMTKELYSQEGCHPLKVAFLPWTQIPLWIIISFCIRNMSGAIPGTTPDAATFMSLSSEGFLWFSDLTSPDTMYILPAVLTITNIMNIEIHSLKRKNPTRFQRVFTNIFRTLSIGMGFVATQLPSAMTLYWATSSSFSVIQNCLLLLPRVRRMFGISQTPHESKTPFKDLLIIINEKCRTFLSRQKL